MSGQMDKRRLRLTISRRKNSSNPQSVWTDQEERRNWWLLFCVNVGTALGAVIAAGFAGFALKASWDSLAEARKATADARAQTEIAQQAERAWLAPFKFTLGDGSDFAPLPVTVSYENVGHEPAEGVNNFIGTSSIYNVSLPVDQWRTLPVLKDDPTFQPKSICSNVDLKSAKSVAYPNQTFDLDGGTFDPTKHSKEELADLKKRVLNKTAIYIVKGCFAYQTLGEIKLSSFCALLMPIEGKDIKQWRFGACPIGNGDFDATSH
jgi:hypothetical protein